VSKSGAKQLKTLIEEYNSLKEIDPQDSILNRHISEYKKKLKRGLGVVPATLLNTETMSSSGPKPFTMKEKGFGINGLIAYLSRDSFVSKVFKSCNFQNPELKDELLGARKSYLNFNFFNDNFPVDGEYIGSNVVGDLNISVYVYVKQGLTSKICTINMDEMNKGNQGVQRGLILAYTYAISELKEKKGAMNAYPQTTKKEYIQTALEQGEPQGGRGDIGWGTVISVSDEQGIITSVKVRLRDGRIRSYNKDSKNEALLRTLYDIIKRDALPQAEIGFAQNTVESMGADYSELDQKYSAPNKQANTSYKELLKLADFFDERGMQDKADCIDKIIYKLKR
jgi:hypothetical protein